MPYTRVLLFYIIFGLYAIFFEVSFASPEEDVKVKKSSTIQRAPEVACEGCSLRSFSFRRLISSMKGSENQGQKSLKAQHASKQWSNVKKFLTAKAFFKSQLNKVAGEFDATELDSLSDSVAKSLAIKDGVIENTTNSKDPRLMKLLHSITDLKKAFWEMIQGNLDRLSEKLAKTREKGREAVERYCDCKGCNLAEVESKDVRSFSKYVQVLKSMGALVLRKKSTHEYVMTLLPFMKAIFFNSAEKDEAKTLGKTLQKHNDDDKGVFGTELQREKREIAGLALFLLIGAGLSLAALIGGLFVKAVFPACGST